ncbi:hypothetical protein FW781_15200 [Chryseobacterium panacisoli]|uniref:Uncharacterized protein n=1 Tax=Chryseobacterium panacisoli TaxID=1807141 RepID=A0A5D8ZLH0_9FLAO|nr:hypothetical protein [Chryseobacterium panacisoli]TZF95236.1 hypothetical protein FW781_15200 [Chryseobacterium panacisoli]
MKIFNFFKKKYIQPLQKEIEKLIPKEKEKIHEFIERCQFLKEEMGIEVPLSVIETFKRYDLPKHNYFYSIFWNVDHDSFIIFYTEAFIELVVTRYKEIHGNDADLATLLQQLDDAVYEFRVKEDCFDRTNPSFDFVNNCYEEFKKSGEELIITMDLGNYDNLVLNKEEKGNVGYNLSSYKTTAGIKYKFLTQFRPLPEVIKETLDSQQNHY